MSMAMCFFDKRNGWKVAADTIGVLREAARHTDDAAEKAQLLDEAAWIEAEIKKCGQEYQCGSCPWYLDDEEEGIY